MKYKVGDIVMMYWNAWIDLVKIVEIEDGMYNYYILDTDDETKNVPFNDYLGDSHKKFRKVYYASDEVPKKKELIEK